MSRRRQDDDVIDFRPEPGFLIEQLAATIVEMMRDLGMDAHVRLPNDVTIEIDKDCTAKEIVKGYKDFMAGQVNARKASNKNDDERKPVK